MTETNSRIRPRLTRLELHGFKSFATKTLFSFEEGITAIVGPNGSGKSNVSDAIRWVLGETSYVALRSKKTEDVIFAGGKGKAPAGMAEVSVTFDNEDRWLPSEFSEVTVTRRAYRGGENQYLINGKRVRLKDVALLTAGLGSAYTVVGQGLVDLALSQRAEERRGLFEHAADLTGLRLKVQDAERNLAESDANVTRLTDLLAEAEPGLRRLERAARQAREYAGLAERLRWLQRGHYRRLLIAANARLAAAEDDARADQAAVNQISRQLDQLTADRATRSSALQQHRERLETHDARLRTLRDQLDAVSHQMDLVGERHTALRRRRTDMDETEAGLQEQVGRVQAQLEAADTSRRSIEAEVAEANGVVERARSAVTAAREERSSREREVSELLCQIGAAERTANEQDQRRALLAQRLATAKTDRARRDAESADRQGRIRTFTADQAALEEEDARITSEIAQMDGALAEIRTGLADRQAAARTAATALADLETRLGQATNRLEVLQRLHDSGQSLFEGPRNVMQWHRAGELSGIRGALAELIAVDPAYDTAIEVALGGHLQDIVVDAWRDAEAAILKLKQARGGRVTFQPIETVRQRSAPRGLPREVAGAAGVIDLASQLVRAEADVAVVVQGLLGRIVVVEDLAASRRIMRDLPHGFSTVTRAGEITRAGGSVTGGSAVRESGVLGRERELRDLPAQIRQLEAERGRQLTARDAFAAETQAMVDRRADIERDRAALAAQQTERRRERDRLASWLGDLQAQEGQARSRAETAATERAGQEQQISMLVSQVEALHQRVADLREREAELRQRLEAERSAGDEQDGALTAASQALATLEERSRAEERHYGTLLAQKRGLDDELNHRGRRAAELDGELAAMADNLARLEAEADRLGVDVAATESERAPLADAAQQRAAELAAHEQQIESARTALLAQERALGQKGLVVERVRGERQAVAQRIITDLEYEHPDSLLPDTEDIDFSALDAGHDGVENEIGRLTDRLRRIGYVSEDVVAEYEAEAERYAFMRTQLDDVQAAAASLREIIAGLQQTMQERFASTFAQVAEAFSQSFSVLFGGGTARLVLTTDEDGAPGGIDIVAQPPGKRLQGLSLLSGGERSLTAVALLFAILRVNPSPFVLLDEVDAALDEANVVRFRDELRTLAAQTQAMVITHNRGTVEIADTLYGITMGGDGVSQMLSLRLSELPLDEDIDVRDLPAVSAGLPIR